MELHINKDFTKFKKERWKGLGTKQIAMALVLLLCVSGELFMFVYMFSVPLWLSCLMTIPPATGVVILVCGEVGGVSILTYLKKRRNCRKLLYRSIREEPESTESLNNEMVGNVTKWIQQKIVGSMGVSKKKKDKKIENKKVEVKDEEAGYISEFQKKE